MSTNFAVPGNNVSTTIGAATAGTGLPYVITLATGGGAKFPTLTGSQYYRVTICQVAFAYSPTATTSNYTIYKADTLSGDTIKLESVLEGTTDRSYAIGDIVEIRVTSGTLGDIHTAVNNLENGAPASSTQFLYNNSGALAGSSLLTQPNSSTVAIKGGTVGTVALTATGATPGSVTTGTMHDIVQVKRPSDGTVLVSLSIANEGAGTDYEMGFVKSTSFVAQPGPTPNVEPASYQLYNDASVTRAGSIGAGVPGGATTNDFYVSTFYNTGPDAGWFASWYSSSHHNSTGSHINIPIYSATRNGIVVHGASSQSADLQQWTDSTPTVLSGVGPAGHLRSVVQSSGGTPSGTPPTGSLVFDSSNNKLWAYNGTAWKSTTLA